MHEDLRYDIEELMDDAKKFQIFAYYHDGFPHQFAESSVREVIEQARMDETDTRRSRSYEERLAMADALFERAYQLLAEAVEAYDPREYWHIETELRSRIRRINKELSEARFFNLNYNNPSSPGIRL